MTTAELQQIVGNLVYISRQEDFAGLNDFAVHTAELQQKLDGYLTPGEDGTVPAFD